MQTILRSMPRTARARAPAPRIPSSTLRYAHQSYGNDQSGHPQSEGKNPKAHLEHPGPEAPAKQGTTSSSSQTTSSDSSSTSSGAKPAIHSPKSAAEQDDPEVRKHNEEMRHRAEKTANQLKEEDNKVDKKFWKGDVGVQSQGKR